MEFITVTQTGANITTGAASARVALPLDSSGKVPRYIRVSATAAARISLGTVASNALATDALLMPSDAMNMAVPLGLTHLCAIQDTAAGTVNVVPLEN
ncbi:hypothetical protein INH39_25570 [Massilia violaceinigra]|uniref:DUF2190 domain-containing protein n=1 Tax=Massilia violaceinigra TaxID=2045208 RepID=A0ABY4A5E8_9BURK|nr:hypothetical protein [Massilia violaceinigra]UOD28781.1 hypothetical protein INH39_25570 [Massilia violaceinigra]